MRMDAMKQFNVLKLVFCIFISSFLPACTMTSVATTGASVVYDRHSIQKKLNDSYITWMAYRKIYVDTNRFKNTNINVSTFNNNVLLTGQVENLPQRNEIERIIRKIKGINELHNLIDICPKTSSLTRISDAWITTKIKTKLLASQEVDPDLFKVLTENGTVYLMGIVPHEEADIAVDIARTTYGVQNVVKVFSYLTICKA